MTQEVFEVNKRSLGSKAKQIIRNGEVPGVIYGEFLKESIPVQIPSNKLAKLLNYNSKGSIIPIKLENEVKNCVVKNVQKNYLSEVIHVDFQYVKNNEVIKMKIPVTYLGLENLELKRLVLENHTPALELHGEVEKIPESVEINVSELNFEDKIFAKDVKLPEGVTLLTEPDTLLAIVNGSVNSAQ